MEAHQDAAENLESVRTLGEIKCPVCRAVPLQGRRSVCSPRCRAKRHRQRRETQAEELRRLLHDARRTIDDALAAVSDPSHLT